jgi:hypothetical protein
VLALGGLAVGPCDILRINANGDLVIDVPAGVLGLGAAGNELDALVIVDIDGSETLTGVDQIYYSLAAGAKYLQEVLERGLKDKNVDIKWHIRDGFVFKDGGVVFKFPDDVNAGQFDQFYPLDDN